MNLELNILKAELKYGTLIDNCLNSDSKFHQKITSRVCGAALSVFSGLVLAEKLTAGTFSLFKSAGKSIWYRRNEFGNYRSNYVEVCEIIRYLGGTLLGTAVGIVHPKIARDLILTKTDEVLVQKLSKEEITALYKMLSVITELFAEHDIEYLAQGGTILGMQRHGGIFRWDDDIDLFLSPGDEQKLISNKFKEALEAEGYTIQEATVNGKSWGFKIYDDLNGKDFPEDGKLHKSPFIDLMTTITLPNGRITYKLALARAAYPEEYFTQNEWDSKEEFDFGPCKIKAPADPEPFLKRNFGENYMDIAVEARNHASKSKIPFHFSKKVVVTSKGIHAEYDNADFPAKT